MRCMPCGKVPLRAILSRLPWRTSAPFWTTTIMPATPTEQLEHLGIRVDELSRSGALWTAREIEQQPQMLQRTHTLLAGMHAELQKFIGPVAGNPLARVILTGAGTSAYIGQCLATILDAQLAARVDAGPAPHPGRPAAPPPAPVPS